MLIPDMLYDPIIVLLDVYTFNEIHVWWSVDYLVLHLQGNRWNKQVFTFVLHKKGETEVQLLIFPLNCDFGFPGRLVVLVETMTKEPSLT